LRLPKHRSDLLREHVQPAGNISAGANNRHRWGSGVISADGHVCFLNASLLRIEQRSRLVRYASFEYLILSITKNIQFRPSVILRRVCELLRQVDVQND
jgi:hypothetical protein